MFDSNRPIAVLGISGSLRRGSYNTAALRAAGELMPDDMTLELADISDLPVYNADDERASGFPDPVQRLRRQVATADALLIATPEYNYSVSGALKNAIDWLSRPPDPPINLMPTAILGVGGRLGTARAQLHMRDIARHNDLRLVQKPEVLIAGGWDKFDDDLRLTDERSRDQIRRLVLALRGLTMRIHATRRRVLLVGRDQQALRTTTTQLRELGYEPVAVTDDDSAMELIDPGQFSAMVLADGIEPEARVTLRRFAAEMAPDMAVAELDDPGRALEVLEALLGP